MSFTELADGIQSLSSGKAQSHTVLLLIMTQQAKETENPTLPFLAKLVMESRQTRNYKGGQKSEASTHI